MTTNRLRVQALKRFSRLDVPLSRLTLLAGANGAGKSTLVQALLLARLAAKTEGRRLDLNGPPFFLGLGEALELVHQGAGVADSIAIEVVRGSGSVHSCTMAVPETRATDIAIELGGDPIALTNLFASDGSGFSYLSAERLGPRDILPAAESNVPGVGPKGEFTASVLVGHAGVEVLDGLVHPETHALGTTKKLLHQAELWLSEIVRPVQLDATWIPNSAATMVRFRENSLEGEWMRPSNTGFGLTFALPIIVAALLLRPEGMLIVENPEAHLHPRAQSSIGSFLARVAGAGVQVVLETHSDHVLNGVRRAVAIDASLPSQDATVLFIDVDAETGAASPRVIRMNDSGDLTEWPTAFFDQTEHDLAALATRRRRPRA